MSYAELCCSYAAAVFASVVALPHLLSKLYEKTEPMVIFLPPVYTDYIGFEQLAHIAQILAVFLPDIGVQLVQWCVFGFHLTTCTSIAGVLLWSLVLIVQKGNGMRDWMVGLVYYFIPRRKEVRRDATSLARTPPQGLASSEDLTPHERPNEATPGEGVNAKTRLQSSQAIRSALSRLREESSPEASSSSESATVKAESEETRRRESQGRTPPSLLEPDKSLRMEMANQRRAVTAESGMPVSLVLEVDAEDLHGEIGLDSSLSSPAGSRHQSARQNLPFTKMQNQSGRGIKSKARRSKTMPSGDVDPERRLIPSAPPVEDVVPNREEEPSAPPIQAGALCRDELQGRPSLSIQQQRTAEETLFDKQARVFRDASFPDHQDVKSSAVFDKTATENDDYLNDVQNSTSSNEPEKSHHHGLVAVGFSAVKKPAGDLEENDHLIPSTSLESRPQVTFPDEASEGKGELSMLIDATDVPRQCETSPNPAVDMDPFRNPTEMPPMGALSNNDVDFEMTMSSPSERTQATTTEAQREKTGDEDETSAEIKQTQSPNARGENVHTSSIVTETVKPGSQTAAFQPQESATDFIEKREGAGIGATSSEIRPEPPAAVLEGGEDDTLGKTNAGSGAQEETE